MNVARHPYSFQGDTRGGRGGAGAYVEGQESPWHKALLAQSGGDEKKCAEAEAGMVLLAQRSGIPTLRYDVKTCWQPLRSQRMLLWARGFGKAEAYMSALGRKHFEEAKSASHTWTVVDAAVEAGLDRAEAEAFINGPELEAEVWKSYGVTIREKGIHAIPYFVFNSPLTDAGPFRGNRGQAHVINGSADEGQFLDVFEQILGDVDRLAAAL